MSVFVGIMDLDSEDFKYYYPTNDLVRGPDIIFILLGRMIIAGYACTGKIPFKN